MEEPRRRGVKRGNACRSENHDADEHHGGGDCSQPETHVDQVHCFTCRANRIVALNLHETRLDTSNLAGQIAVSPIADTALKQHNWVSQPVGGNIVGEFPTFVVGQLPKNRTRRMESVFSAWH